MNGRYDFQDVLPGQWVAVDSSFIAAIRWGVGGVLEVRTSRGKVLPYAGVPEGVFRQMLAAESVGKFLNYVIKRQYDYLGERS